MAVGDYTMYTPDQYGRLNKRLSETEAEVTRLKELNREMAKALKGISYCEIPGYHQKIIIELLAKAEEGG